MSSQMHVMCLFLYKNIHIYIIYLYIYKHGFMCVQKKKCGDKIYIEPHTHMNIYIYYTCDSAATFPKLAAAAAATTMRRKKNTE